MLCRWNINSCLALVAVSLLLAQPNLVKAEVEFVNDLNGLTEAEKAWLEGEAPAPGSTDHVNEGQLKWLEPSKQTAEYQLHNQMLISNASLESGWVEFIQCHYHIDPINKVEIVYGATTVRNLQVKQYQNIGQALAQQSSILMVDVQKGAEICITGQSKTLEVSKDGWLVRRGPYMRKFFDGFYPMQVTEVLDWVETELKFIELSPKPTKGFEFELKNKRLEAHYRFEGKLVTEYQFE